MAQTVPDSDAVTSATPKAPDARTMMSVYPGPGKPQTLVAMRCVRTMVAAHLAKPGIDLLGKIVAAIMHRLRRVSRRRCIARRNRGTQGLQVAC